MSLIKICVGYLNEYRYKKIKLDDDKVNNIDDINDILKEKYDDKFILMSFQNGNIFMEVNITI